MRLVTAGRHRRVDRHGGRQASLGVRRLVERGDVDALEPGQAAAQRVARALALRLRQPLAHHLVDLAHHFLAVAQHEGVDEVGQRLGVEGAVPAGQHQRVAGTALGRVQGNAGQVDEVDHVGVDELGREVEGEHVEGGGREMLLDAEERHPRRPHRLLQIDPRGVGALGHGVGPLVEDLVEDLESLVRQADLVGVGVEQEPGHLARPVLGVDRALLATDVARRLGHLRQQPLELGPDGLHVGANVTTSAALSRPGSGWCSSWWSPAAFWPGTVVVVVGVPNGALVAGAARLGGLAGVGVVTVELTGLVAR